MAGIVASTTYGVAKAASVIAVGVLNCAGGGLLSTVLVGLQFVWIHAAQTAGPARHLDEH